MSEHRASVMAALAAVQIRSATSYAWCGTVAAPLDPEIERAMGPDVARDYLVYQLQQELYGSFYCRGFPVPEAPRARAFSGTVKSSVFVGTLTAANHARRTLQAGWRIKQHSEDQMVVERDGLALWVTPAQTAPDERPEHVSLRLPAELLRLSPGFYMALGEKAIDERDSARLVRLYWHLTSTAAARLLALLTTSLNRAALPFQLKVVNDPDGYSRCDAGVLYIPRALFADAAPAVESAYRQVAGELRETTPVFTKRLARGLGLAEDPGDGQSFGMHRALLLAHAVVRAHELDCHEDERRAAVVEEIFSEAGLDLDRPYLCPGSIDDYALDAA